MIEADHDATEGGEIQPARSDRQSRSLELHEVHQRSGEALLPGGDIRASARRSDLTLPVFAEKPVSPAIPKPAPAEPIPPQLAEPVPLNFSKEESSQDDPVHAVEAFVERDRKVA